MPGRRQATVRGRSLVDRVVDLAQGLGLSARTEVKVGRRLWGAERRIDIVLTDPSTRRTIGVECKYQGTSGTAEEKIPAIIDDISAWPIPGLVVFDGAGFSTNMRHYLFSTGKAVEFEDLDAWLRLFFGLDAVASA